MKKAILLVVFVLGSFNFCLAQEWFSSLDVAKKLALAQDKMLFVMWEDTFSYPYYLNVENNEGKLIYVDITVDVSLDSVIWEYFIPVKLNESKFKELSNNIQETRGIKYYNKLIDDSIKIMDANGNILNLDASEFPENLILIIKKYALNTSFLKDELMNYSIENNFTTTFRLAAKYLDFAIYADKSIRNELIDLANIYFDEAKNHLINNDLENKIALLQKCELLILKEYLILKNPKKALRQLKRMNVEEIDDINRSLYAFINYTAFKLLEDEENASLWESKVGIQDLKTAKLIININR